MTHTHNTGMYTESECELCGEEFTPHSVVAEMYDPDNEEQGSLIVHYACGKGFKYELA